MCGLDAECFYTQYSDNMHFMCVSFLFLIYSLLSLDWTDYQWTGIGDEGATALTDPRVIKNFKTLE